MNGSISLQTFCCHHYEHCRGAKGLKVALSGKKTRGMSQRLSGPCRCEKGRDRPLFHPIRGAVATLSCSDQVVQFLPHVLGLSDERVGEGTNNLRCEMNNFQLKKCVRSLPRFPKRRKCHV